MDKFNKIIELFPDKYFCDPIISQEMIESLFLSERVDDVDFDKIFPSLYQYHSAVHWSPIEVAQQIANWIAPLNKKTFVDIGCGVGKLCILLGILTYYEITGVEQRSKLVKIASNLVHLNKLNNVNIHNLNMLEMDWDLYDIYYLYNPFQEHVTDIESFVIEKDLDRDEKYYAHYTSEVFRQISWAKPGKVLITYHGYGGSVPSSWRMVASKHINNGDLTMWIKEDR